MTTMELIERGIGHNCLSDAYDLGRAEAIETVYNTLIDSVPIIENRDIIYGFSCAIQRVEQLKEHINDNRTI